MMGRTAAVMLMAVLQGMLLSAQSLPSDSLWLWPSLHFHALDASNEVASEARQAGLSVGLDLDADAFHLPFSFALLTGSFLDSSLKQQAADRLNAVNHARLQSRYRLYYRWQQEEFLSQTPALLEVGLSRYALSAARFTDDAFTTVFFGNSRFAGEWADYSGTAYLRYNADLLDFTLIKFIKYKNWRLQGGIGLSAGLLRKASRFCLPEGLLYTDPQGLFLDAAYRFSLTAQATTQENVWSAAGWLLAGHMYAAAVPAGGRTSLALWLNDLGALHWGRRAITYRADSSVQFTGLTVQNLFSAHDDDSFLTYSVDSLLAHTGARRSEGAAFAALPLRATLAACHQWNASLSLTVAVLYESFPSQLPMVMLRPLWHHRSLAAGPVVTVGGISGVTLGASVTSRIFRNWGLSAGAGNLAAALWPRASGSAALFLKIWSKV
ncbi:MAG: hypothetical protein RMK52_00525 [Chitinophagales bacterium]|nr:hypothetical protein [Chitinophagales bacterium]